MDADVVVIGAGLAGLRAARILLQAGLHPVVLEAGDAVGGRERTDRVDGFLLDRGFHVINPAYPALGRAVDLAELDLHPFGAGLQVLTDRRTVTLSHPWRRPRGVPATVRSGLLTPATAARLGRWVAPVVLKPSRAKRGADTDLARAFRDHRLCGTPLEPALDSFLAGVLADESGSTSANFVRLLLRSFVLGVPGLPAAGVQRLPELLARPLPDVRLRTPVHGIDDDGGRVGITTDEGMLTARAAVVAVGPAEFGRLTGQPEVPIRGLTTWWFATREQPSTSTLVCVDGRLPRGPVVNAAVLSNVVPYAPAGHHLIEATCVRDATETEVRRHAGEILGTDPITWTLLRRDDIPHALPAQLPPLRLTTPARLGDRLWAAGDHRTTASIQGALVSGERAARAVIGALDSHPALAG